MASSAALRRAWANRLFDRPVDPIAPFTGCVERSSGAALATALRPGLEARFGGSLEVPLTDKMAELLGRLDESKFKQG